MVHADPAGHPLRGVVVEIGDGDDAAQAAGERFVEDGARSSVT
ncbi:hypothetical protein ABH936_000255 [Dermacoccus sp. GAS27A]